MLLFQNYSVLRIRCKIIINLPYSEIQQTEVDKSTIEILYIYLNLGHQTSSSGLNSSIFGNAPFSSMPQVPLTSTGVSQKFPQQQQTNMFPTQPFPHTSNPFMQQPFGASKIS